MNESTKILAVTSSSRHPSAPGPFDRFRDDHADVQRRLEIVERWLRGSNEDDDVRALRATLAHLERQFATHMAAEDSVLFPGVSEAFPALASPLAQLAADHAELRSMLAGLLAQAGAAADAPDEQARVAARDFVDLLRLHIHREEVAVFDVATRALSPAEIEALAAKLREFADSTRSIAPRREPPKGSST